MSGRQWLWIFSLVANVLPALSQCPAGRHYHEGACYRVWNSSQLTFTEAENDCVTAGGHLASIPNIRVQRFVESLITTFKSADPEEDLDFWVGLTWDNASSVYTWMDNSTSLYRNWLIHPNASLSEPLRNLTSGGCVTLYHSPHLAAETGVTDLGNWTWGDDDCEGSKAYICRYPSESQCQKALISGDWAVPVTALTSSGSLTVSGMRTEVFSILGTEVDLQRGIPIGGWSPIDTSLDSNYLQVDLGTSYIVREVWMQGREDTTEVTSEWVRAFQMDYSVDNTVWTQYTDKQDGVAKAKLFDANFDRDTIRKIVFNNPIFARYVRINPQGWKNAQTLRFELFGCPPPVTNDPTASKLSQSQSGEYYYTSDYLSKGNVIEANTQALTDQDNTDCKTLPEATYHTVWSYMLFLNQGFSGRLFYVTLLGKGRDLTCLQKTHPWAEGRPIISLRTLSSSDLLFCDLMKPTRSADLYTITCEFVCNCPGGGCPGGVVVNVMDTPTLPSGSEWKVCEVSSYVTL